MQKQAHTVPCGKAILEPAGILRYRLHMKCPVMRILCYWAPAVLWPVAFRVAAWVLVSGRPPMWAANNDKLMHFLYFGVMALLLWRAFRYERGLAPWPAALAAFSLVAIYGGIDEFSQQYRPHRSADIRDWLADLAGASLPFLIAATESIARLRRPAAVTAVCPETSAS